MRGYIVIPRNIQLTQIWGNPQYFRWWIDLVMMANYEDAETLVGSTKIAIRRGQVTSSLARLASRWDSSRTSVHRFLCYLEDEGYVSRSTEGHATVITIKDYEQYQSGGTKEQVIKVNNETVGGTPLKQKGGTVMEQFMEHPFGTDDTIYPEQTEMSILPCLSVTYGLLEEGVMEQMNPLTLKHPFETPFAPISETNVEQFRFSPHTPFYNKINKIINKKNNEVILEKKENNINACACSCEGARASAQDGTPTGCPDSSPQDKSSSEVDKAQIMKLLEDSTWVEAIMMANHMKNDRNILAAKLEEFHLHLVASGSNIVLGGENTDKRLKYHFSNWLRIRLKEEKNEAYEEHFRKEREELYEQRLSNERRKSLEYNRRRETEISPVEESTRVRKVSHSDQW